MSDEKEIDPRRKFILAFRRHRKWLHDANFSERVSIDTALARTKIECLLSEEHQRDVDGFLKKETAIRESRSEGKRELPFDFEVG